jgi:hypothetical protein
VRFLAFVNATPEELRTIGDMAEFLTKSAVSFAKDDAFDRDGWRDRFTRTFVFVREALEDEAFRRYSEERGRFLGGFSVSAFEAISTGVAANLDVWEALGPDDRSERLRELAQGLWVDETFRQYAKGGVRASTRVPQTIPLGRRLFAP